MKDADEGADNVVWLSIGTEIAAADGPLDQGEKSAVDMSACSFDEAHGATGNRVHDRKDQALAGHVVDEEKHPGSKSVEGRHGGGETLPGSCQLFDFAAVDGFDQGVAGGEMAVERA